MDVGQWNFTFCTCLCKQVPRTVDHGAGSYAGFLKKSFFLFCQSFANLIKVVVQQRRWRNEGQQICKAGLPCATFTLFPCATFPRLALCYFPSICPCATFPRFALCCFHPFALC